MPAKRKSGKTARATGAGSPARLDRPAEESIELATPVVLPDDGPRAGRPAAPKSGPVLRNGGGAAGVGRGRNTGGGRQYAFRRS
ncbi:hypothetical protein O7626_25455 [Micromonospora sp. WMMD1102]|uniref:hypothetical protein n=1 Tax=Micromonospora sp. WMMD1102 TaxID=3016105 RepID=UPI00241522EB|nr:hypothetical protein [Micromonospora sp. WMMD1102]MDG4789238.1 hypothetical protein [Micromonospora sp. WMMD1102]